ncbi:MAG TPA: peptide ABC transporter substrate-binding protein, partial [Ktedonobacteraceae bacterium]|nr:peptide ABC transporter substrate-binding protein [Ktedonobacteraceae bacterium]
QVSADGLTYTFTLKPHLKFSDGSPLTADDVAYSINRTVLPATKSDVSNYLQLLKDYDRASSGAIPTLIGDSIIVNNPSTITLIISKPAAYFLEELSYPTSYVVERKLIEKYGEKWTDHLEEGGGDGPFKVLSYGHTTSLDLVPNPNYEGRRPKLQKIQYFIASDRDSNYKAFLAGQYDLAPLPPAQEEAAKSKPGFQNIPALAIRHLSLNYLTKPLDNIKFRQALALAINKDLIVHRIIGDFVTPTNHIVPKGLPGYDEKLTGPAGVVGTTGDQKKAQALLKEALQESGYSDVHQIPQLTLTYGLGYQAAADTLVAITDEWKQVLGISIKLQGIQENDLNKEQASTIGHDGPLQIWYTAWGADYPDPQDFLSVFFSKGAQHNTFNYGQNTSTDAAQQRAVQAELLKADGETNFATRKQLYNDAEQKIVNDVGWISTYQSAYGYAVNPKLRNWKPNSQGSIAPDDYGDIYFVQ